jgi:hypothetical protein
MKRSHAGIAVLLGVAVLTVLIAVPASAATATVTGNITGDPVAPGVTGQQLGFSISVSSKTLQSFTLSPPSGWVIPDQALTLTGSSGSAVAANNQVTASNVGISGTSIASLSFTVKTGCVAGNAAWTLIAQDTQGRNYANSSSSDLTTNVNANCHLAITTQPKPARAGETITNDPYNQDGAKVTVQLQNGDNQPVGYFQVTVAFDLALDGQPAPGLHVDGQKTNSSGNASFGLGTLYVTVPNEPQFSDYTITPKSTDFPTIVGTDPSDPFDIWQAACSGSCQVKIRNNNDVYTGFAQGVFLTASQLPASDASISCEGQTVIFSSSVFVHDSGAGTVTMLQSHVTRADMKAAANNGQAHVQWCVGVPNLSDWHNPAVIPVAEPVAGGTLYVGFATACPNNVPDQSLYAPCITRQYGDGNGGNFTEGWLPGDPVRRT